MPPETAPTQPPTESSNPNPPAADSSALDQFLSGKLGETSATTTEAPEAPETPETPEETPETPEGEPEVTPEMTVDEMVKRGITPRPPTTKPQKTAEGFPHKTTHSTRDYTGLSFEERNWFRQMSREAYDKLYPVFKEYTTMKEQHAKELAEARSARLYEVEGAWALDPTIAGFEQEHAQYEAEESHWRQQLVNVRKRLNGDENAPPYQPLEWDAVNKRVVVGEAREASAEAEAEIMAQLQVALNGRMAARQRATEAAKGFKENYSRYNNELNEVRKRLFGKVEEKLKPAREAKLQMFPPLLRNRPEVLALSEALCVIDGLIAQLKSRDQQAKAAKLNGGARVGSIPDERVTTSTAGKGKETPESVMAEMKKQYGL